MCNIRASSMFMDSGTTTVFLGQGKNSKKKKERKKRKENEDNITFQEFLI